ncbi:3-oxoacyl-[acyl-carrier protein] reductase [Kitasatospora sp. MAA4]|uniref:SDR family oxidoreductase n=1 Tax=Kitasatospora sp. MAA4 TaxID=3035093 RepID=UPI0024755D11|nr:SDR family oxidoreductase [Kitasatospora sp. MAA4]MDH6134162.1 3-oxoacyl-[acyl-carrier protein] reductase [Kitasatospora sp. MAA4]
MDLGLRESVHVVTGGSRGLGFASASQLVAEGAQVVISGRDADVIDKAVERLGRDRALGVVADNGHPDTPDRLTSAALSRFGRLDGMILSTGGPPTGKAFQVGDQVWRDSFESVFLGALRMAKAGAENFHDGGAVLFVLSTSARVPIQELDISNGLRPGLAMVAKALAEELGPRGIRVNGVLPGKIATDRMRHFDASVTDGGRRLLDGVPLGRPGLPEEFGRVAAFLQSPAASYLTGAMIPVDGGMLRAL